MGKGVSGTGPYLDPRNICMKSQAPCRKAGWPEQRLARQVTAGSGRAWNAELRSLVGSRWGELAGKDVKQKYITQPALSHKGALLVLLRDKLEDKRASRLL